MKQPLKVNDGSHWRKVSCGQEPDFCLHRQLGKASDEPEWYAATGCICKRNWHLVELCKQFQGICFQKHSGKKLKTFYRKLWYSKYWLFALDTSWLNFLLTKLLNLSQLTTNYHPCIPPIWNHSSGTLAGPLHYGQQNIRSNCTQPFLWCLNINPKNFALNILVP